MGCTFVCLFKNHSGLGWELLLSGLFQDTYKHEDEKVGKEKEKREEGREKGIEIEHWQI